MGNAYNDTEINKMKTEATQETKEILDALEKDYPGVTEGLATALGAGTGAAGSLAALTYLGVTGLSAAGITSGLAAAGALAEIVGEVCDEVRKTGQEHGKELGKKL